MDTFRIGLLQGEKIILGKNLHFTFTLQLVPVDNRNKRKAQNEQKKPRANLVKRDKMPVIHLTGIEPDMGKGADVFRYPYKQSSQERCP